MLKKINLFDDFEKHFEGSMMNLMGNLQIYRRSILWSPYGKERKNE